MVNSLRVVNKQQNSSFEACTLCSLGAKVRQGQCQESNRAGKVCVEALEKEKQGKLAVLECGPTQYLVPREAELDTVCVFRKSTLGSSILNNRNGKLEGAIEMG